MADSVPPYGGLAPIYDHVMRHVDYAHWAAYLEELFAHHEHSPGYIVDLACGTGSIALELFALGLPVRGGADASAAMLREARERALQAGGDMLFVPMDLRDADQLPAAGLGPADTAVCMYDSCNYLLELEDVDTALGAVWRFLEPGGLFVFDVCTQQNSLRYFSDLRDSETGPGFQYARHSYYEREQRLQHNDFSITLDDVEAVLEERHVQRIYALADLRDAVERSAFELLGVYDDFTFSPGTERSDRVHFAARRPAE